MEPLPKFGGDATLDAFNESRRKRQRLETARAAAEAAEEAGEEVEPAWIALDEFDLFATLRIPRPHGESIKLSGGDARVRASYHRQAQYYHPTWGSAGMGEKEAELHLLTRLLCRLCRRASRLQPLPLATRLVEGVERCVSAELRERLHC